MLKSVVEYFDEKMQEVGYRPWENEFSTEDIGNAIVGEVYHLEIGDIAGTPPSHTAFRFDFPIIVRVWAAPTHALGTSDRANELFEVLDSIFDKVLPVESRNSPELKGIYPSNIAFEALDDDGNDNIVQLTITFNNDLQMEYRDNDPVQV